MAFTLDDTRIGVKIVMCLGLPIWTCSCIGLERGGGRHGGDLDALYAANAAHLGLREAAEEHGVEVRYGGALRFENRGIEPVDRPDLWMINSASEHAPGRTTKLGLQLFDIRLVPVNSPDESDAAFAYRGRVYAFKVTEVKRGRRADEVLLEMGISPLDFVKEAARLVSDDKKGGQKALSAPG